MITAKEAKKQVDEAFSLSDTLAKIERTILHAITLNRLHMSAKLDGSELLNKDSIIKCLQGHGYSVSVEFGNLNISWSSPK